MQQLHLWFTSEKRSSLENYKSNNTTQHDTTRVQHETTRVQYEATRVQNDTT